MRNSTKLMAKLRNEEKKELLRGARSGALKKECGRLSLSAARALRIRKKNEADAYIDFVTHFNAFISHTPKAFKRIKGSKFSL